MSGTSSRSKQWSRKDVLTTAGAVAMAQANFLVRTIFGAQSMVASVALCVTWIPRLRSFTCINLARLLKDYVREKT